MTVLDSLTYIGHFILPAPFARLVGYVTLFLVRSCDLSTAIRPGELDVEITSTCLRVHILVCDVSFLCTGKEPW
jgi:hypothetical protein